MRRLAAILAADVVGYSRLMGDDEAGTLAALRTHRAEVFDPVIAERGGRLVKLMGDGALVEFPSVVEAVEAALAIQQRVAAGEGSIKLRIGINLGDVIIDGDDIYGDGVNVAARLEALAEPGGICIASIVHESIGNRVEAEFADTGEHQVKGIARPIRVWKWPATGGSSGKPVRAPGQNAGKPSIAVLPFANMSGDAAYDPFVDGMTEDVITTLSRMSWYDVKARTSTFSYKGTSPDIRDVAKALGVNYVLEGSARVGGDKARISVQLIEAATGNHVWADRYDRNIDDQFAIQDEIARSVSSILSERIWQDVARNIGNRNEETFGPYEYAFYAIELLHKLEPDEMARAKIYLSKALELAPDLVPGHLGLGFCYICEWGFWGDPTNTALDKAYDHAVKLQDLAPNDAQTYRLLSRIFNAKGNYDASWQCVERALSINSSDGDIIANRGTYHLFQGEFETAHEWFDKVLAVHTDTPHTVDIMRYWKSLTCFGQADYEAAVALVGSLSSLAFLKNLLSCACYDRLGLPEMAQTSARAVMQARPQIRLADLGLWQAFRHDGDKRHLFDALSGAGIPE